MWFAGFTAAYAVLVAYVFWGTWGLGVVPIMPDCATTFPVDSISDFIAAWRETGKFIPSDIMMFIGSPYFWIELQYAIAGYCAALGLAYYCRGRGLSRLAAYGGGLLLAFCGYWFSLFSAGHMGWFHWMTYGVFAFGLADRAIRKNKTKNWILLGACVAWASFRQPDLWLMFTVFTAIYFIWCCVRERKLPSWKGVSIAAVTFLAIAAPSLRGAAADKARRDNDIVEMREAGSDLTGGGANDVSEKEAQWIFVTNWSLPPKETLEFIFPRINGDTSCPMVLSLGKAQKTGVRPYAGALGRPINATSGNYRQHSLYVGFVTCLLALLGIAAGLRGRNREVAFFLAMGVLFYLLSLGRNFAPLYRVVFALPVGGSIRAPVKWHHLTEFCICVCAAFGIQNLFAMTAKRLGAKTAGLIVAAIVATGACDLARVNRLYCAAQTANTQIGPLPQPIPQDPMAAARLRQIVAANGMKVIGTTQMPFRTQNGDARAMEVFMVEQKTPRPKVRKAENPMTGISLALAWLSLCATFFALAFSAFLSFRHFRGSGVSSFHRS